MKNFCQVNCRKNALPNPVARGLSPAWSVGNEPQLINPPTTQKKSITGSTF